MSRSIASLDKLAADSAWLRKLARSLVGAHAADDLVHDTYLVAATKAPDDNRPLVPWLARVMRNLAGMSGRATRRRLAREHALGELATPPAQPDELAARVETQRMLAGLVLELPSAERDVILLHYFEGLTSIEIGRRLGIPHGTVRWRMKQALDELRARLDARDHRWTYAIGALAYPRRSAGVGIGVAAAVGIALAVVAIVIIATRSRAPDEIRAVAPPAAATASPAPALPATPPTVRPSSPRKIGVLFDADHHPVAGATVELTVECPYDTPPLPDAVTEPDGSFAFAIDAGAARCQYWLFAHDGDRVARARFEEPPLDVGLTLGPDTELVVRVRDVDESPIAGARISLATSLDPLATTDARGVARIAHLGGARALYIAEPRYQPVYVGLDALWSCGRPGDHNGPRPRPTCGDTGEVSLHLTPGTGFYIDGVVVDAEGLHFPGVLVAADHHDRHDECRCSTAVDPTGAFRLWLPSPGLYDLVVHAMNDGYESRVTPGIAAGQTGVRLLVGERSPVGEVTVTVVDPHGTPVPHATVRELDTGFRAGETDAHGRYTATFTGNARIVAHTAALGSDVLTVTANGHRDATIQLRDTRIRGVVVDTNGAIARDALVRLEAIVADGEGRHVSLDHYLDDSGRFEFAVPGGTYSLVAYRNGTDELRTLERTTVRAGDDGVRLILSP